MASTRVILITGCSTGVGLATATLLARSGHVVYASMRNLAKKDELQKAAAEAGALPENLHFTQLDVTNDESVASAIAKVVEEQGKLDVLINNAGFSVAGSADDMPLESAQSMFDTNLWGIARTVKAALPHFRRQAGGQIINLSSVGGLVGFPFQEYYCASKWAVEGYTESLAITNAPLNIKVSLVEPAAIRTPFFANAQRHLDFADPGVKALWDRFVAGMAASSTDTQFAQTAEEVAEVIKTVVDAEKPHLRYQTGVASKAVAAGVRVDPTGDASVKAQVARFFKE